MEKHSHKLRNLFSFISLIALSMLVLSCADDNKEDLTGLITSFKVKVNNEVLEGNIDEDACQISFQGIKNLNAITDVEYQLKEEASVGLENIFKILRIDYYRRLTYLDQPNIKKGGVRIALRFSF